ncbi:MAG: hypothetical protein GY719_34355 [bacterium]|nr:hypothetical protein [bacterium]
MTTNELQSPGLKQILKEALVEALQEQRELLHEVFVEVLEEIALAEAIRQGLETEPVGRDAITAALAGEQ